MRKQPHRVWRVAIASGDDEKLGDRDCYNGFRFVHIQKLPERKVYLIEAKGNGRRAVVKAIKNAVRDGVSKPVLHSIELLTRSNDGKTLF
jgi:hypothetical protein